MSVRLKLVLSDDLNEAIERAARESDQSTSQILLKSLTMFLAAREGAKSGSKVGLVNARTRELETEFVGLLGRN